VKCRPRFLIFTFLYQKHFGVQRSCRLATAASRAFSIHWNEFIVKSQSSRNSTTRTSSSLLKFLMTRTRIISTWVSLGCHSLMITRKLYQPSADTSCGRRLRAAQRYNTNLNRNPNSSHFELKIDTPVIPAMRNAYVVIGFSIPLLFIRTDRQSNGERETD